MENVRLDIITSSLVNRRSELFENMLGIEELWVDMFWGQKLSADNKNFGGDVSVMTRKKT
jgi:hypothetical protein